MFLSIEMTDVNLFACSYNKNSYYRGPFGLFLSGCINLGPDYMAPHLGIQTPESYEYAPTGIGLAVGGDRWWEVFGDSELNLLVDEVLKHNWDIKQAAARVLEVRARYVQVRSDRFPDVSISGTKDRRRIAGGGFRSLFRMCSSATRRSWTRHIRRCRPRSTRSSRWLCSNATFLR